MSNISKGVPVFLLLSFVIIVILLVGILTSLKSEKEDSIVGVDQLQTSHFGLTRFECTGNCFCSTNERRNAFSASKKLAKYAFFSSSSILAFKMAENYFRDECHNNNDLFDDCPFESVESEVLDCEEVSILSSSDSGNIRTFPEDEQISKKRKELKHSSYTLRPIGIIRSPWKNGEEMPMKKKNYRKNLKGSGGVIEVFEEYRDGIKDVEGFSHINVFFLFDQAPFDLDKDGEKMMVNPFGDKKLKKRGVFATCSPLRPNSIGMTMVKVVKVEGLSIFVDWIDAFDGTPVIDLKPYFGNLFKEEGENFSEDDVKTGWFKKEKHYSEDKD